jgi:hypothetical protein
MSITQMRRAPLVALAFAFLLAACIAASSAQAKPADWPAHFRTSYQPAVPHDYSSDAGPSTPAAFGGQSSTGSTGNTSDDDIPWLAIGLAAGIPLLFVGGVAVIGRKRIRQRSVGLAA